MKINRYLMYENKYKNSPEHRQLGYVIKCPFEITVTNIFIGHGCRYHFDKIKDTIT